MRACYDSRFYEARALWHCARVHRSAVQANVRLTRLDVPWSRRPEVDGVLREGRHERAIEVKSYLLTEAELAQIARKYVNLGFTRLTVVAPGFEGPVQAPGLDDLQLLPFTPDLGGLRAHYQQERWPTAPRIDAWLARGGSHFRYSVAEVSPASPRLRRTLNQVKKNLFSSAGVAREVRQRVLPTQTPIRVHWSPRRSLFPKDLYFRRRRPYLFEAPLVFDIDGPLIHRAMFPCTLDPATGLCADCVGLAREHARRLVAFLAEQGCAPEVFFSGHSGFHVYAFELQPTGMDRRELVRRVLSRRIMIDRQVTVSPVPIIAFPGSVHGVTARPLVSATPLDRFHPEQAMPVGGP